MRRRWSVLALVLLAGCGFPTQDTPRPVADEQPATETTAAGGGGTVRLETVTVWCVDDDLLVPLVRRVASPVDATAALESVAMGVSTDEAERGLRSAIPSPAMVLGAEVARGTVVVALASEFLDIPAGDQVLALAQIVYTLTDLRGIGRVRFEIDGQAVVVPLPAGDSTDGSVSRDDFASLLA